MPSALPPALPEQSRSLLVTLFGWFVIVLAGLLTPISFISFLMILAGGPGTSTFDPIGFLTVVCGPPAFVVAGIGLLLRQKWAWWFMIVALAVLLLINIGAFLRGPIPEHRYVSPGGVPTTVLASEVPSYVVPIIVLSVGLLILLFWPRIRAEFFKKKMSGMSIMTGTHPHVAQGQSVATHPRGPMQSKTEQQDGTRNWRVGHTGRDEMYYEEFVGVGWQRIRISGEMLMGRAHHVIYFATAAQWQEYPEWARHRRDEIIARIKSEFRPPDYEYQGDDVAAANATIATPAIKAPSGISQSAQAAAVTRTPTQNQRGLPASLLAIVTLLGFSFFTGWRVVDGLFGGVTYLPTKFTGQHTVSREHEPVMFYVCIVLYAILALGALALLLWGLGVAYKSKKGRA